MDVAMMGTSRGGRSSAGDLWGCLLLLAWPAYLQMLVSIMKGWEMGFCISELGCKFSLLMMPFKWRCFCTALNRDLNIKPPPLLICLVEPAQSCCEVKCFGGSWQSTVQVAPQQGAWLAPEGWMETWWVYPAIWEDLSRVRKEDGKKLQRNPESACWRIKSVVSTVNPGRASRASRRGLCLPAFHVIL